MTAEKVGVVTSKENDELSNEFPTSFRVLVVDDDTLCLQKVEKLLQDCNYYVTPCFSPKIALSMLREDKNKFDIVLSGVHMKEMDGVTLLRHILKEMDLPVIMMSTDDNKNAVMKSLREGACHYLIKPIEKKDIITIWQHVVRKRMNQLKELKHPGDMDESEQHRKSFEDAGNSSSGNDESGKSSKRRKEGEDDAEVKVTTSMPKRPRVVWTPELHAQFVAAVDKLGIDKAVPMKILELMDNPLITRENVASHLQKFRLHQRRGSQHESGVDALSMDHEVSHFGPISPVDGRLDLQAPFFPVPLHNRALHVLGLGRSIVPTGFDVSNANQSSIIGVGQHQLTNTLNQVQLLHGLPTLHVNDRASSYFNYTTGTGFTSHVDNFIHGNHNSSTMLHMAQTHMSGHLLNGQPASGGANEIGQVVLRNETFLNNMLLDITPGITSNGTSLDNDGYELEFYNVSSHYEPTQSNQSMSPPPAFDHQAPVFGQRNEQIQIDHGHPDNIVLNHNSLYDEDANNINAEISLFKQLQIVEKPNFLA